MYCGHQMIEARIANADDTPERRKAERRPVELEARVRELGNEGFAARILNISSTGFMAEADGEFEVGARVWLILPGQERAAAQIRWVAGNRVGAEFAEPGSVEIPAG